MLMMNRWKRKQSNAITREKMQMDKIIKQVVKKKERKHSMKKGQKRRD